MKDEYGHCLIVCGQFFCGVDSEAFLLGPAFMPGLSEIRELPSLVHEASRCIGLSRFSEKSRERDSLNGLSTVLPGINAGSLWKSASDSAIKMATHASFRKTLLCEER